MWAASLTWYEIFPWAIVALWTVQLSFVIAGMRHRQALKASTPVTNKSLPRLSVLVAARNEEDCIETCLRSLARQDHPNFEIIAVDDRSTDNTAAIMHRLSDEFGGLLQVVQVKSLPAGWLGKTHAMHQGMQLATGDWICFSDADCEQLSNQSLSLGMQEAMNRKVDLLSLTPQIILKSIWERITVPVCSWVMMVWFQPRRVNDPRLPTSYANGAYLLMNRKCYDTVGGWARVRSKICEDVAFAQIAKSNGSKILVLQNEGLYRAHMYESIRESWDGWSRIFYGTLSKTALIVSMIRLLLCSIVPTAIVLVTLIGRLFAPAEIALAWDMAVVGWVSIIAFQQIQALIAFRLTGSSPVWSLTVCIGQVILLGMLTRALLSHFGWGALNWRGAVFQRGQLARPALAQVRPPV